MSHLQVESRARILGSVTWELLAGDGSLKTKGYVKNLVTAIGDQMYASRGVGLATSPLPTGMKLGTGTTLPAKTGAGAALVTYLAGSNKAFDATFPSAAAGVVTYKRTYAPGEATTASAITEVAIVTEVISSDTTSTAAETISRAIISGVPSKAATDTLIITWTHTLIGG